MAARSLGWETIKVEVVDPDNVKKYILVANKYRAKKPPAMQKREADAYREMHAGGEVTKEEMVGAAREKGQTGGETAGLEEENPARLAAQEGAS